MSIENGERFIRMLESDSKLREKVRAAGTKKFKQVTAEAGASCSAYDAVAALSKRIDRKSGGE